MKDFWKKPTVKKILTAVVTFSLAMLFFVVGVNFIVCNRTATQIVDIEDIESLSGSFDCILVLGAGVWSNGTPSHMLEDRLKVGEDLFFAGASDRLLMSGDHAGADYNEVNVMKDHAVAAGIPGEAVFLDHYGLSTYESIWRAKELFGVDRVLIVTQSYHLYRSLYVAEALGMEAYGVSADLRPYRSQFMLDIREVVARIKDFVFSYARPQSQYPKDKIDLSGNGNDTNDNPYLD